MPFTTWPDRADVPRSAARPLRYIDRFLTVTQGEVFYATEVLAALEGLERGPAGNTSLAAALAMARELDAGKIVVVQETEYTGAGKHPIAQLGLAKRLGVEIARGDPAGNVPGRRIVIPEHPAQIRAVEVDLERVRQSYLRNALAHVPKGECLGETDLAFLAAETRTSVSYIEEALHELLGKSG
jgi:hypothetical protein